jgi:23S rRNA (pseudouridine1915-N3)-methyltransferase
MKLTLITVGRCGPLLQDAVAEYEARIRRYWTFEAVEVKEERARKGTTDEAVKDAEAERILKRVPQGSALVALTRTGDALSSAALAQELEQHAMTGTDVAFVIGGALGLGDEVTAAARRSLRLSSFTFPHDIARLVLLEQLYRAGTIRRGEPYHKGTDAS